VPHGSPSLYACIMHVPHSRYVYLLHACTLVDIEVHRYVLEGVCAV
jgi:hypothetical protein